MTYPLEKSDQLARRLAVASTRREFIGGLLKVGASLGATLAFANLGYADIALASHDPCGPSPDCPSGCCASQTCWGTGECRPAKYGHSSCNVTGAGCWAVPGNPVTYCCDCCSKKKLNDNHKCTSSSCDAYDWKCSCWWGSL